MAVHRAVTEASAPRGVDEEIARIKQIPSE
jgi:hypothetical protein